MTAAIRSRALARFFLVTVFGVSLSAAPASAQKQGGSITVGLELDIPGFDPLKVGVLRHRRADGGCRDLRHAHLSRRRRQGPAQARAVLDAFRRLQDLDLQAAARRQVPRRHAVQRRSLQGQFRPAEGSRQQVPLRLLHRGVTSVEATDELTLVYNLKDPAVNFPALVSYREPEQRGPVADGVEGQGRRLQPQSGRHRTLCSEILDRRRPHGAGEESRLLGQGQHLPRPHRAEAAA